MKNTFLTIPAETFSKISSVKRPEQALYLYMYYLNLAKLQKTNLIHTSVPSVMEESGWGRLKVVTSRNNLKNLGLIEDFRPEIGGKTFVKLNELDEVK